MTELPLTPRMRRICALVPPCPLLIEVGADNAYMSLALLKSGTARRAVASDVNDGPLERARQNRTLYEAPDLAVVKSDGLAANELREAAARAGGGICVLIAGMGGALICRILADCSFMDAIRTLVLAPQSEVKEVRQALSENGWAIEAEDMIKDGGKYYPALRAVRGESALTEESASYGPVLLKSKDPVLKEYLAKTRTKTESILKELRKDGKHPERTAELEEELSVLAKAEAYYEMQ